jgi:aryl-alcohol dehydrogenase-like predicted oxidoreductase
MRFRTLGRTGWKVSEVGFGAWGIGGGLWQDSDDRESIRALDRALECGINFFDTALAYGQGHSERLLGDFLQRQNDRIYVATKIPPLNRVWPAQPGSTASTVFPSHHIIESTERSLKNLRVDTLDLQQFHVWRDEWINETEWWETVQLLKEQGKIRHFGVSVNDHEPETALAVVRTGKVDTVQVIYNIFDQSPAEALFPLCLEHNVGVIVRVPLDEGALTGRITPDTTFPEKDFRNKYFRGERKAEVFERVKRLESLLGEEAQSLPELALRFCLSHSAVSTVIVGMRTVAHVEQNTLVADGRTLSTQMLEQLKLHQWKKNFYH